MAVLVDPLEDVIRQLRLTVQRAEMLARHNEHVAIIAELEQMKAASNDASAGYYAGYNRALDDIIELLRDRGV
jgi:hypothetical protein